MPKESGHKEGKDFEWRTVPGSNAKARHFFTKDEKAERSKPKTKRKTTSRASSRKTTKEAPVTPRSKPSKITTKSLDPIATGAEAALRRYDESQRMQSYDPVETKASQANRRERGKRVPGRALIEAISNAFSGKGETDPTKIASQRGSQRAAGDLLRSPSKASSKRRRPGGSSARGYAKGGVVKANCGASRSPRRKMK